MIRFLIFSGAAAVSFCNLKPWLQQYPSFSKVLSLGPVGLVVERLGLVPVFASFEASVAMDDCASRVSCLLARVEVCGQQLFLTFLRPWCDPIALPRRDFPRHGYGLASFLPTCQHLPNFECFNVHSPHVVLAWTGPCFLETPSFT